MERVRIFIDFWNFQLNWNKVRGRNIAGEPYRIDWKKLPLEIVDISADTLRSGNLPHTLELLETRVYASLSESEKDRSLGNFLSNTLDRFPGYRVFIKGRTEREKALHCRECNQDIIKCPNCEKPLKASLEKGVDTQIATDLMSFALDNAYDYAVLVSQDKDFIPAIDWLQGKGHKIINGTFSHSGHQLAKCCYASFNIDDIVEKIKMEEMNP